MERSMCFSVSFSRSGFRRIKSRAKDLHDSWKVAFRGKQRTDLCVVGGITGIVGQDVRTEFEIELALGFPHVEHGPLGLNVIARQPFRVFQRLVLRRIGLQLERQPVQAVSQHDGASWIPVAHPLRDRHELRRAESRAFEAHSENAVFVGLAARGSVGPIALPGGDGNRRDVAENPAELGGIHREQRFCGVEEKSDGPVACDERRKEDLGIR